MPTSGSVDFTQTRNELIQDALQLLGVYGVGRTISNEDMVFASSMLNKMVKAWQAKGLHLWAKEEAYLFINKNSAEYQLGNAATDANMCARTDAVLTKIGADEASGQTVLTIESSTGMAVSDIIGVHQDGGSMHYSTIVSVDSSTQVTITDALTAAAGANNSVYTFTSRTNKPLRVLSVRRKTGIGDNSATIPMTALSHQDYFDLPNKAINGLTNHFYYNPDVSNGRLYLWPRPESGKLHFEVTYERLLEDFDASTDTADFPGEWLECITYQLAVRLAPAFGKDEKSISLIVPMATDMLAQMMAHDAEVESLSIVPDTGY